MAKASIHMSMGIRTRDNGHMICARARVPIHMRRLDQSMLAVGKRAMPMVPVN